MSQRNYVIVIEKGKKNYSAYLPDLPGCVTTGKTKREIERNMKEAIELHIAGLLEDGLEIPKATTSVSYITQNVPDRRKKRAIRKPTASRRKVSKTVRRPA